MKKTRRTRKTTKIERTEQMKGTGLLAGCIYKPSCKEGEVDDLEAYLGDDVRHEIALLRIYIRRLSALAKGVDDLEEAIVTLGAVGRASTQVASLLRSQKAFEASKSRDALEQALTELMKAFDLS